MNREHKLYLFTKKYSELKSYDPPNDLYEVLKASAILRQLLLESLPDEVNEKYKLKIEFKSNNPPSFFEVLPHLSPVFDIDDISPNGGPYTAPRGKEQFLNQWVGVVRGERYSVKDAIQLAANAYGGIHHKPKGRLEQVKEVSESLPNLGLPAFIHAIPAITKITVIGYSSLNTCAETELNSLLTN